MTESACEITLDDYGDEGPEFLRITLPKASRRYYCGECQRPMEKGARYARVAGKWEGDWLTFRFCSDCFEISNALGAGHVFGGLWAAIRGQFPHVKSIGHCLSKLSTPSAKAFFTERWREWRGLA